MILVTGARGVVGTPLCQNLQGSGRQFMAVSRSARSLPDGEVNSLVWDLSGPPSAQQEVQLSAVTTLIHCAPIWLLPERLSTFENSALSRLIVFSSTSVLSKQTSSDPSEQTLVNQLASSEQRISEICAEQGWNLTILRPSMIYGYGRDQNVMHIARFIRRYGVMFVVGAASGKRQPVHANDLVNACLAVLNPSLKSGTGDGSDGNTSYGKVYNLAGGEILSYRNMVERIFVGLGKTPRVISLPLWSFRIGLRVASMLTRFSYTPAMANRMNQDLSYDYDDATRDFAYTPASFMLNPARDLTDLSDFVDLRDLGSVE